MHQCRNDFVSAQRAQSHPPPADFGQFLVGHWLDSLGHSIIVACGERGERGERERVQNAEVLVEMGFYHSWTDRQIDRQIERQIDR